MDASKRVDVYQDVYASLWETKGTWSGLLDPDLGKTRYHLGTSISDRIVPYVIDDDILVLMREALRELAFLYAGRNRAFLGEDAYDTILLTLSESTASLRSPTYTPPEALQNPTMRTAMERAPRILPGMDAGVLASWWGTGGRGRDLIAGWAGMQSRAVQEMAEIGAFGEPTPYLLQFVLLETYAEAGRVLADYRFSEEVRDELHAALLLALHLSHHVVRAQVLSNPSLSGLADQTLTIRWAAMVNPGVSFHSSPELLRLCRFYPVPVDLLGARAETVASLLARSGQAKAEDAIRDWLAGNAKLSLAARSCLLHDWVRERLLGVLAAGVEEGGQLWQLAHRLLRDPRALQEWLQDKKIRRESVRMLESLATGEGMESVAALVELLQRHNPKHPVRKLYPDDEVFRRVAASWIAQAGDQLTQRVVVDVLPRLKLRTGQESDRDLGEEYEAGRLYRFGLKVGRFLKSYERGQNVGHYFIDVKDYTRRTALLKEEVMAEFIRREFYEPILSIAQEFYHGLPHLSDRGGLHLNNVLGDALSFSGDIVALVRIARQIRFHLDAYAESLSRGLDESDIRSRVDTIAARFSGAQGRVEAAGGDTAEVLRRLDAAREEAIGRVTGEKLIAGSFIAHGSPPSVITFEAPIWGEVQVAIGEKINESARGTARTDSVLASMQALLAYQQKQTNNPKLSLPFRVYVANTLGIALPPEAELALRYAFLHGDLDRALSIYQQSVKNLVGRTFRGGKRAVEDFLARDMALYNAGDAVSGDALEAYRDARRNEMQYEDRTVLVADLEPEIRRAFAFTVPELRLVVGRSSIGRKPEIFRYAGTVVFRGFERDAPTDIWEMINPDDPIGRMLVLSSAVIQTKTAS